MGHTNYFCQHVKTNVSTSGVAHDCALAHARCCRASFHPHSPDNIRFSKVALCANLCSANQVEIVAGSMNDSETLGCHTTNGENIVSSGLDQAKQPPYAATFVDDIHTLNRLI